MEQLSPTSPKKPYKSFEHSLSQYNNVVIPERVLIIQIHMQKIEKAIFFRDYESATREQRAAKTEVQNLKKDLSDIDAFRIQVNELDLVQFDKAIGKSRSRALLAIEEFTSFEDKLSISENTSKPQVPGGDETMAPAQILESKLPILFEEAEKLASSCEKLHDDSQDIHTLMTKMNWIVQDKGGVIDNIEHNVNSAAESAHQGNLNLKRAAQKAASTVTARARALTYPLICAALGTLVGGPVGLFIGLEVGVGAAFVGGIVGFLVGRLWKKAQGNKLADSEILMKNMS